MPCSACGAPTTEIFRQEDVPVHSVRLCRSPEEARALPRGDIVLGGCAACGLIENHAFRPELLDYGQDYNPSQACSPTFNRFHRALAERLVAEGGLAGRQVLEVGCGEGEFLRLLRAAGVAAGVGYDPMLRRAGEDGLTLVAEAFRAGAVAPDFDAVCCKMTLEHIAAPRAFVSALGSALGAGGRLFLMVPEAGRILADGAFQDIYYEHCNYLTAAALTNLLAAEGFAVEACWTGFGDQYLMLRARRGPAATVPVPAPAELGARCAEARERWRAALAEPGPHVLWGGGSKAVAFVSAVGAERVAAVVDIDPRKQGAFLPGSGLPIRAPEELPQLAPRTVIAMNPVYRGEIAARLAELGIAPALRAL